MLEIYPTLFSSMCSRFARQGSVKNAVSAAPLRTTRMRKAALFKALPQYERQ